MKKKAIACIVVGLTMIGLVGCKKQITLKKHTLTIEAGQKGTISVADFVRGSKDVLANTKITIPGLTVSKIGTYNGTITYRKEKYNIKVKVKDRIAPTYSVQRNTIINDDKKHTINEFLYNVEDFSSTRQGFLSAEKIKKPKNIKFTHLKPVFEIKDKQNEVGQQQKFDVSQLKSNIHCSSDGYYLMKAGAVDQYGNQTVYEFNLLIDRHAPKLTLKDKMTLEVLRVNGKDHVTNLDILKNIKVADQVDGDLTKKTKITFNQNLKHPLVTYAVKDAAGNKMVVKKEIKIHRINDKTKQEHHTSPKKRETSDTPGSQSGKYLLKNFNIYRRKQNLEPYLYSTALEKEAMKRSKNLSIAFQHKNVRGIELIFKGDEENLTSEQLHRQVLKKKTLKKNCSKIGVGYYLGKEDTIYWCILFK